MVPCSHLLKLGQSVSATVKRNLQAAIAALPQIKAIDPADAAAWIETALERHGSDPARLDWMVRRLGGLGPSDTAALQAEKAGRDVGRGIHEIVSEKLLKRFPAAASDDVVRLERAKPTLQAQLRSVLPTAVQQPAMHRLFEAGGAPKHPWLVGAPGDILAVKKAIVLVDYRAPSQKTVDEYRESGPPPEIEARMHHYTVLGEALGVPITKRAIAVFNPDLWKADVYIVERDKVACDEIKDLAADAWRNHVLKANVPPAPEVRVIDPDLLSPEFHAAAMDFARYAGAMQHCKDKADTFRTTMIGEMKKLGRLDGQVINSGLVQIVGRDGGWDIEAMAAEAAAHGVNVEACRSEPIIDAAAAAHTLVELGQAAKSAIASGADATTRLAIIDQLVDAIRDLPRTPGTIRPDLLIEQLQAREIDPSGFRLEVPTVGFNRARKGPLADQLTDFKEDAADLVDKAISSLTIPETAPDLSAALTATSSRRTAP